MLRNYYQYLEQLESSNSLLGSLNLKELDKDISDGLFFESSIPQGYGLGSSGALVAAIYYSYSENLINGSKHYVSEKLQVLKSIFAQLESFFHGTSSGIDPLNCYIKMPLLIEKNTDINIVGLPRKKNLGQSAIFLINTFLSRKTGPLVNNFMNKCRNESGFKDAIKDNLLPITNSCIDSFVSGNVDNFFSDLNHLSSFQIANFEDMIPNDYMEIWEEGLNSNDYYLKLCGSGGGGFILGFCKDFDVVKEKFDKLNINVILVFRSYKSE